MRLVKSNNFTATGFNPEEKRISIFENTFKIYPFSSISIRTAIKRIKEGTPTTDKILRIRTGETALKASLPMYCFSGIFSERKKEGLTSYSSLIILDFDNIPDPGYLKIKLSEDRFTFLAFVSPSGKGLKALIRTDNADPELHRNYFEAISNHYNRYALTDRSGSDLSRGCYDSYDPELYLNSESDVWTDFKSIEQPSQSFRKFEQVPPELQETDQTRLFNLALKRIQREGITIKPGERNNGIFKASQVFNRYGVSLQNALFFFLQFEQQNFPRREIEKAVQSAYSRSQYFGVIKPPVRGGISNRLNSMRETN